MKPLAIKVLGIEYGITWEDELKDPGTEFTLDGRVDFRQNSIYIQKDLHPIRERLTICHELCHCIVDALARTSGMNEREIEAFSQGLFAVMVDNPPLAQYLFGEYQV